MTSHRRVLVAGGTGGTGRLAVRGLGQWHIPTRILTRDPHRAGGLGSVEVVQADLLVEDDCRRAVDGCAGVLCAVGRHRMYWKGPSVDGDGIIHLVQAAEQAGVCHPVVSSLGGGDSGASAPLPVKGFLRLINAPAGLRQKERSEAFVRASGLACTILCPACRGRGRDLQPERFTLHVPAGLVDGQVVPIPLREQDLAYSALILHVCID